jgi:hypothetical protein
MHTYTHAHTCGHRNTHIHTTHRQTEEGNLTRIGSTHQPCTECIMRLTGHKLLSFSPGLHSAPGTPPIRTSWTFRCTGVWSQGLALAEQVLYHLNYAPSKLLPLWNSSAPWQPSTWNSSVTGFLKIFPYLTTCSDSLYICICSLPLFLNSGATLTFSQQFCNLYITGWSIICDLVINTR